MHKNLLILKEKVDLDPSSFDLWGYFNPETGETKPCRVSIKNTPGPQFERLEKSLDGKAAIATHTVKMKYEDFFADIGENHD